MTWLQVCISALAVIGFLVIFCAIGGYILYRAEYKDEYQDSDNWGAK
jgi:hypothetical protein